MAAISYGSSRYPLRKYLDPRGLMSLVICWYVYIWLVVFRLPPWKIWKSIGMIIPNIWKNKTSSKPPTRYNVQFCEYMLRGLISRRAISFLYPQNRHNSRANIHVTQRTWVELETPGQGQVPWSHTVVGLGLLHHVTSSLATLLPRSRNCWAVGFSYRKKTAEKLRCNYHLIAKGWQGLVLFEFGSEHLWAMSNLRCKMEPEMASSTTSWYYKCEHRNLKWGELRLLIQSHGKHAQSHPNARVWKSGSLNPIGS